MGQGRVGATFSPGHPGAVRAVNMRCPSFSSKTLTALVRAKVSVRVRVNARHMLLRIGLRLRVRLRVGVGLN